MKFLAQFVSTTFKKILVSLKDNYNIVKFDVFVYFSCNMRFLTSHTLLSQTEYQFII